MKRLNLILTLSSFDVLLVTVERFSFTTKILLNPYHFLRVHEVFQMLFAIAISALLPFFILKTVSNNFTQLKTKKGLVYGAIFILGMYFYATGNGVHEVASFLYNNYCNIHAIQNALCGGYFFNDYYFGNIVYFVGAFLFTLALVLFEKENPDTSWHKKDFVILFINALIYMLTIFVYAAFDTVLVGLWYGIVTSIVLLFILIPTKDKMALPYTIYVTSATIMGTLLSLLVRLH